MEWSAIQALPLLGKFMQKQFLSAADLSRDEAEALLSRAALLKQEWRATGGLHAGAPLRGKTLAMVFEKPSLRTRVAFEAGITQLGGARLLPLG